MSGTIGLKVVFDLSRTVLTFLGFVAIIVGILAVHVWMGGHGPSTHGVTARDAPAHGVALSASPATSTSGSATAMSGSHQVQALAGHAAAAERNTGNGESAPLCLGSCGNDGAALGMCLLAVIMVVVLVSLVRSGRLVPGSVLLRGPPLIRLQPLSIPVPSLTQLCISRT
ncbi:hypothetical protein [Arthrobacter sp. TMN-50]